MQTQLSAENITEHYEAAFAKMIKSFEEFTQMGSGWTLKQILHLELCMAKYHPLRGSSYMALPEKLRKKKAILNIQNFEDEKCFLWCLLAHRLNLDASSHPERVSHYEDYEDTILMGNVQYPVPWKKIPIIEKLNHLRINVFLYESDEVVPLYVSDQEQADCINLLLLESADEVHTHYVLIRNFERLLGNLTKQKRQVFYCYRCLHRFRKESLLKEHKKNCSQHAIQAIKMPKPGENVLEFTGTHMQHPMPYAIYADFESILEPISTATPSSQIPYTMQTSRHVPCGYSMIVVGPDGKGIKPPQTYRGQDAVKHFLKTLFKEKDQLKGKLLKPKPLHLTSAEQKAFEDAVNCHICKQPVAPSDKRRDHCHVTGVYRGAAHNSCNLNFKLSKKIPVIFHNLKNYDAHHIMLELGKFKDYSISIIPTTLEKYISFTVKKDECPIQLTFLDSFQFLNTSLEKLVKNLKEEDFNILKDNNPFQVPLTMLTRKGVYPYSYITNFNVFNEEALPPKEKFFNDLTEESLSEEDFIHACRVWEHCKMKNIGDYHDFYVTLDVLLLADVFQNFRKICLKNYNIDPTHVYTSPGLSWQACLKMTNVQLELLTDVDMLLFIEQGVRGGVCQISRRYSKANNPQVPDYNPEEKNTYISYLDANNLYGWAMSQHLPHSQFEWVPPDQLKEEDILTLSDTSEYGYIFEVTLEYPNHLHELHNEYPLAPQRLTLKEEMLSDYAKQALGEKKYTTVPKLILNLEKKSNYVLHYRNLKQYLNLGMHLTQIHKTLKFKQSPWLKEYIDFNTEKRKLSSSEFEKNFFKLLNNSIYGKTIENLRKRRNVELVNQPIRGEKLVASPAFTNFKIFSEDLVAVERVKTSILMNRPIYVGFTILELSKTLMYNFHYNHIKAKYKEHATLLFTDTDSLCYEIQTENFYKDLEEHHELYDFSDFPSNHPLHSTTNKKVVGKFKDELNGEPIHEFIGLKPKMYSLKTQHEEKKRAKGVSTHVVSKKITHQDYKNMLFQTNIKKNYAKQKRIAQDKHQLYTVTLNKIALNAFDDKRYLLEDGYTSLAYGHYKIQEQH